MSDNPALALDPTMPETLLTIKLGPLCVLGGRMIALHHPQLTGLPPGQHQPLAARLNLDAPVTSVSRETTLNRGEQVGVVLDESVFSLSLASSGAEVVNAGPRSAGACSANCVSKYSPGNVKKFDKEKLWVGSMLTTMKQITF